MRQECQGLPEAARNLQKLEEGRRRSSLELLVGARPRGCLHFRLLASRTVRETISVVFGHRAGGKLSGRPRNQGLTNGQVPEKLSLRIPSGWGRAQNPDEVSERTRGLGGGGGKSADRTWGLCPRWPPAELHPATVPVAVTGW